MRRAPSNCTNFGTQLDQLFQDRTNQPRSIELVKHTSRGEYAIQFSIAAWPRVKETSALDIPRFGRWVPAQESLERMSE